MRILHHLAVDPASRAIRLALAEKGLSFDLRAEPVWDRREDFLALNPKGEVPVLEDADGTVVAGFWPVMEYLDEIQAEPPLLGSSPKERAESRRLVDWFQGKFQAEVTDCLVGEKIMKRFLGRAQPSSDAIRAGIQNLRVHLSYIGYLVERRRWLAGDRIGMADLVAAAHLSAVDYLGDVPWAKHDEAQAWYARVKSRPGFRPLLADRIPGLNPPPHYADLDF
ncbi:MAG: glutathione S-transferase family protein [Rhodospirillales bacterium]